MSTYASLLRVNNRWAVSLSGNPNYQQYVLLIDLKRNGLTGAQAQYIAVRKYKSHRSIYKDEYLWLMIECMDVLSLSH